jgi:hypothetical protein
MKSERLGKFHIHVNAHSISSSAESLLVDKFGFKAYDPCGHSNHGLSYEISRHFVKDSENGRDFKSDFVSLKNYFEEHSNEIDGFMEGEFISLDTKIEEREFDPSVALPFKILLKSLKPGTFRQDEIHIILDKDRSDSRLIDSLKEAGFFSSAYLRKTRCIVEVLSVQGSYETIQTILPQVLSYMQSAGGAVKCNLMEEKIVRWWVSNSNFKLPPIVDSVVVENKY